MLKTLMNTLEGPPVERGKRLETFAFRFPKWKFTFSVRLFTEPSFSETLSRISLASFFLPPFFWKFSNHSLAAEMQRLQTDEYLQDHLQVFVHRSKAHNTNIVNN